MCTGTTAVTGRRSYNLTGSITKSGLTGSNTYIVSYWTLANTGAFSIAGTMSGYPMKGKTVTVNNTSCKTGYYVAHHHGYVKGWHCKRKTTASSPDQYDAQVTCTSGSRKVFWMFTQNKG